jgi:hypothetical protein
VSDVGDDERLIADLRAAMRDAGEVPASFVAAGKAAFAWRTIDAELATAADRGAADPVLAGTRTDPAALRALTFSATSLVIEVELTAEALLGQVVPPQAGQLDVQQRDRAAQTVPVDDLGWFAVRPAPAAMFRLRLRTAGGTAVVTEWVTP